jgi:hypothetical protein
MMGSPLPPWIKINKGDRRPTERVLVSYEYDRAFGLAKRHGASLAHCGTQSCSAGLQITASQSGSSHTGCQCREKKHDQPMPIMQRAADYPSGDGCAAMTLHQPVKGMVMSAAFWAAVRKRMGR